MYSSGALQNLCTLCYISPDYTYNCNISYISFELCIFFGKKESFIVCDFYLVLIFPFTSVRPYVIKTLHFEK